MNWLLLSFITILFWGIGGYLGKYAGNHGTGFQVYLFEAIGTSTAALIYFLFFHTAGAKESFSHFDIKLALPAIAMGALWGIGTLTFILALTQGKASLTVPLTASYPVVTVLLAMMLLHESVSIKEAVGITLVVGGVALLSSGGKV